MIIKSHIRGGYRSAAQYLKDIGRNERTRLVEISDINASSLDEAFRNMWVMTRNTKVKKPLHHISINPFKDERLTDEQVLRIVERCEQKYGYKPGDHQRVIVEHVLNGRQHFHAMWNRVSLTTNRAVWPGEHWKKSKQVCREMERELGLKRPVSRRMKRKPVTAASGRKRTLAYSNTPNKLIKLDRPNRPHPVVRRKANPTEAKSPPEPLKPVASTKGWPEAAIIAWESWGRHDPVRFFRIWSELSAPGFSPSG